MPQFLRKTIPIRGANISKASRLSSGMRGTTRRPLEADRGVERLASEETEVHRVLRFEGATPTRHAVAQ